MGLGLRLGVVCAQRVDRLRWEAYVQLFRPHLSTVEPWIAATLAQEAATSVLLAALLWSAEP